ncbi:unnamed protein product [Lactuca saligna]|uniref:WRC domain-containing protein n=1 Tax=Lactuca saligna TaxID=75948 RepID=A0AA35ZHB4_LACSI|nr:unnamed protein product [Lactuca saligna]
MRIRKNAKISALLSSTTNLTSDADESLLKKNLCQLNQSPWDIITFPSSDSSSSLHQFDDYEVYYNVNLAGNGSSVDSVGDLESVALKTSREDENDNDNCGDILGFKEEIVLCDKLDEKGWQCGRVVKNGNKMCDHHLSTTKKKSRVISGSMTGARPHRTKKRPTTNPHDFYYYSGFGPSWGKKRGATDTTTSTITYIYNEANTVAKNGYERVDVIGDIDIQEKKRKRLEPEISEVGSMKVELDNIDDDKKGKVAIIGKKRGRKPIKARSLKSLM